MWRLRMLYSGFEEIRIRNSKINSSEGMVDYMICNKSLTRNHVKVSKRSNNDAKKDIFSALLSGQSLKSRSSVSLTENISSLQNLGNSSFEKAKPSPNAEEIKSVRNSLQGEVNGVPLILCSKDEIRKLAESLRTDKEKYLPPIQNSGLYHSSVVHCLVKEEGVDIRKKKSFRGVNAKIPQDEMLHILDSSSLSSSSCSSFSSSSSSSSSFNEGRRNGAFMNPDNLGEDLLLAIGGVLTNEGEISSNPVSALESPVEIRQPSPVSVLESPLERECLFKQVPQDSDEFEMQLDLLKHELNLEKDSLHLVEEIRLDFEDEEERDFSYLLDVLIDSGFHTASDTKRLVRLCYEPDSPVRPSVFSNLEKKYKEVTSWQRSERKLLFDMINSILAEILAPCMDLRPWVKTETKVGSMWGPEGLVEKVWQILARTRESLPKGDPQMKVFDTKWIELRNNMDLVGREIERRIKDELIEEIVCKLLFK